MTLTLVQPHLSCYLSGDPTSGFTFKPWTGNEPDPKALVWDDMVAILHDVNPGLREVDRDSDEFESLGLGDALSQLFDEMHVAHLQWAAAKLPKMLAGQMNNADVAWLDYLRACQQMSDQWAGLRRVNDGSFTSAVLRLVDAQNEVLEATKRWDVLARSIAQRCSVRLPDDPFNVPEVIEAAGGFVAIAAGAGFPGATSWQLGTREDYHADNFPKISLTHKLREEIGKQRAVLRELHQIVGSGFAEPTADVG